MNHRAILAALFDDPSRTFSVELWDGTALPNGKGSSGRLVIRQPRAVASLVPPVQENALALAFARGDLEIEGDTSKFIEAVAQWEGPKNSFGRMRWLVPATVATTPERLRGWLPRLGRAHTLRGDARAVHRHYDLSNDFFRLFLDDSMTYSCAFFPTGGESLSEAQEAKLELIERKLKLRTGDRLLDIGCGWGSLLMHAARRWGAVAVGTTISREQFREARSRIQGTDRVEVYGRDYRDLPVGPFDKIVSIGMMEHVGRENLGRYFEEVYRRLAPGGLFLNHAIADISDGDQTVRWMRRSGGGLIQRHIFPDSDLPPLGLVVQTAEKRGFEVRDVECLREHYVRTLRHWLHNLEARIVEAERIVGRETARLWRLYLGASAVAFRLGKIGVYQVLLAKRNANGEALDIPSCRGEWYRPFLARTVAS